MMRRRSFPWFSIVRRGIYRRASRPGKAGATRGSRGLGCTTAFMSLALPRSCTSPVALCRPRCRYGHSSLQDAPRSCRFGRRQNTGRGKHFHVLPCQDVTGEDRFRFVRHPDRMVIRIQHIDSENGIDTVMSGALALDEPRHPCGRFASAGGMLRVIVQIERHAMSLKPKGGTSQPAPG